jgi:hypothetical protein
VSPRYDELPSRVVMPEVDFWYRLGQDVRLW